MHCDHKGSEVRESFLSLEDEGKGAIADDSNEVGVVLPDDEEELLAGIAGDLDLSGLPTQIEDLEDYDFFGSGGGLELDSEPQERFFTGISKPYLNDEILSNGIAPFGIPNGLGTVAGEHPYGEHPSRTLFVRNINSNVEDSELRSLFEQYGDIRTLYTACKHRGFVMISYFDIRHARAAMRALQNKPLRRRKLDIHFSIPKDNPSEKDINQGTLVVFNLDPSVSNDDLYQIFGVHGEIKEIRETPHKRHHKFIEFYDVRAAESALKALNRSDIAGKRIKLEPSRPGGTRRNFMQQVNFEFDAEEPRAFRPQTGSPLGNSPPGAWTQFGSPVEHSFMHTISKSPRFGGLSPGSSSISYSMPGQNFSTSPVSFAGPSPNSGIGTLSGPQFLWGSPSPSVWSASSYSAHHVGSAPTSSPLNRRFGFLAKSPEAPPSFGTIGSNRNQSHLMNSVNGSMFPRPSPYLGAGPVVNNGFIDIRSRSGLNQADNKKQYELDLEKITSGEDSRTTLMIKNIPNKYTSKMLLAAIDEYHTGTYDFLYLPIDFKNKCNVGYAFINMISPAHIIPFYKAFNGKKWEKFNSEKVAVLAYARIQGKSNLVTHFQNSSLMNEDKCFRPILFRSESMLIDEENATSENMNVYVRQVDKSYSGEGYVGYEEQS